MKRSIARFATVCLLVSFALAGCETFQRSDPDAGWTVLLDSTKLNEWNRIGDANWRVEDGAVVSDKGPGFLVTKNAYRDFRIRAEFWAEEKTNSGIFIRCADPNKVAAASSYEVNIFDARPDPSYGTGAIVDVAKVSPMPKAAGRWNTFEIAARGPRLTVVMNGQQTVDIVDTKFRSGPIALQSAGGTIKFRRVLIQNL